MSILGVDLNICGPFVFAGDRESSGTKADIHIFGFNDINADKHLRFKIRNQMDFGSDFNKLNAVIGDAWNVEIQKYILIEY
jgi:hypothetical protein